MHVALALKPAPYPRMPAKRRFLHDVARALKVSDEPLRDDVRHNPNATAEQSAGAAEPYLLDHVNDREANRRVGDP